MAVCWSVAPSCCSLRGALMLVGLETCGGTAQGSSCRLPALILGSGPDVTVCAVWRPGRLSWSLSAVHVSRAWPLCVPHSRTLSRGSTTSEVAC